MVLIQLKGKIKSVTTLLLFKTPLSVNSLKSTPSRNPLGINFTVKQEPLFRYVRNKLHIENGLSLKTVWNTGLSLKTVWNQFHVKICL